jgi:REP element-mobilizing transposase RayT
MQNKFQNKYRISSARLQSWDYSKNGAYFITICTQNREHFFGKIVNQEMQLSELGKLTQQFWIDIPIHFPFVELGNFVVMPNHVHGILIINNPVETRFIASDIASDIESNNENNFVIEKETRLIASLREKILDKNIGGFSGNKNPMLHDNISKIIRWYKGRCSYECRKINSNFGWQSRFHDHIIRNSKSFDIIQNYIVENPSKWENDTFY